jgi:hypothetical protein
MDILQVQIMFNILLGSTAILLLNIGLVYWLLVLFRWFIEL